MTRAQLTLVSVCAVLYERTYQNIGKSSLGTDFDVSHDVDVVGCGDKINTK